MKSILDKVLADSNQRLMESTGREFRIWGREKPKKKCFRCNDVMSKRTHGYICKGCKKKEL